MFDLDSVKDPWIAAELGCEECQKKIDESKEYLRDQDQNAGSLLIDKI
jgi:hypothetical protein